MSGDFSILHPSVRQKLESSAIAADAITCDAAFADTAEFCARYNFAPEDVCNTIIVVVKKNPKEYVACLVRSDSRLDVNHKVAAAVAFKRLSFASGEETAGLSGMEIGGVTLVGLPPDMPILIDERVMERSTVILGGGNRTSKVRVDPRELLKLANARVADIAVSR
jgi:prolyl-tRNA editing enzyme YbaK/EbsC (Cys-tRNA(Pro) deacylase)